MECFITFQCRPACIGCYWWPSDIVNVIVWGIGLITHFISIVCCVVVAGVVTILACSLPTDLAPAGEERQVSSDIVHALVPPVYCNVIILYAGGKLYR